MLYLSFHVVHACSSVRLNSLDRRTSVASSHFIPMERDGCNTIDIYDV